MTPILLTHFTYTIVKTTIQISYSKSSVQYKVYPGETFFVLVTISFTFHMEQHGLHTSNSLPAVIPFQNLCILNIQCIEYYVMNNAIKCTMLTISATSKLYQAN